MTRCVDLAPFWHFRELWAYFGELWAFFGELWAFFLDPIYSWGLYVDDWALFHSDHLVTLAATFKQFLTWIDASLRPERDDPDDGVAAFLVLERQRSCKNAQTAVISYKMEIL